MRLASDSSGLRSGLGFRPAYHSDVFLYRSQIDFLEIIADHYFDPSPQKQAELSLLAEHFVLVPHGLNLSLGSAQGLNLGYLKKLAALIHQLNPPWWSEHIAFTRTNLIEIGHLTPLPYTWEAVDVICRNVNMVRRYIDAPLILENITNPLILSGAEMSEVEFISEIVEQTDCGLLLDVTNLYTNSVNFSFDPIDFLNHLPIERIIQLHYAGGERHGLKLIDSHSQATPPEVWELMETIFSRALAIKGTILERDDRLPSLRELLPELENARELGRRYHQWV